MRDYAVWLRCRSIDIRIRRRSLVTRFIVAAKGDRHGGLYEQRPL